MDPVQRRRSPRSLARLAAILLANCAALGFLWWLVAPAGDELHAASDAPVEAAEAEPALAAAGSAPALAAETAPRSALARRAVEQRVRALIGKWTRQAESLTKGKVKASRVLVAVDVRELGAGGEAELAIDADRPQPPASNMKLVTSAAALVLLGSDWSFETLVEGAGPLRDGRLDGDLVVRAGGDPLYDPRADGSVDALLAPLIEELRARGLRAVEGDLVLDEGDFEAPAAPDGWPDEGQRWSEYCALAGGFSANRGCLTAVVRPGKAGGAARVTVEPRHHGLPASIDVNTVAHGKLVVRLDARSRAGVRVEGSIPRSVERWSDSFAHPDPVALFGSALRAALNDAGIRIQGGLRRERGAKGGEVLARLRTSLSAVLAPINTDSNNGVADQLFLALGHAAGGAGTRAAAASATRRAVERLGVPADGLTQIDGSGLSRGNRATARQIAALLAAVLEKDHPASALYRGSLAVAGESGTLDDRMQTDELRGKVQAKTGFIGGVSALSGVVQSAAGPQYVFSILIQYPLFDGLNTRCWKKLQDEICALLVGLEP
jgi:D-alanyl-D-alanine carboxypeptidase/D-alanyl-D-alanine-endopeptidase (penicillin-binding protein 4)